MRRPKSAGKSAKAKRSKRLKAPQRSRRLSTPANLQDKLDRALRERDEALEQQAATADVLKVISGSSGDLQSVFQAILANATRICGAKFGNLILYENGVYRDAALFGAPPAFAALRARNSVIPVGPRSTLAQVVQTKCPLHIANAADDPLYTVQRDPARVDLVEVAGARSLLVVPLLKNAQSVGALAIFRQEIRPFTNKQIELVQNFAAQAVIAVENTRLLTELRRRTDDLSESLDQQTATSEVLKVISSSPGEVQPVFEAMLENALRICEAKFGTLIRFDGEKFHYAAGVGTPPALVEFQRQRGGFLPDAGSRLDIALRTRQVTVSADDAAEKVPGRPALLGGARSSVIVPMLHHDQLVGVISIYRTEIRPFTDKQIELLQNFAAQAVIAIENTRLLNELRESLQQQIATADVLKVISSSPGELEPVFGAMLEKATRLCEAKFGILLRYKDGLFHPAAMLDVPPALAEFMRQQGAFAPKAGRLFGRLCESKSVIQVLDRATEEDLSPSTRLGGARSSVAVPMLKEGELVGALFIYRTEVRPFTDKQIELVQNFAAQAVIAIENARLLNELRAALEEQTATSEVLQVISSKPGELDPVFRAMLKNAIRVCNAGFGMLTLRENDGLRIEAFERNVVCATENIIRRSFIHPHPEMPLGRVFHQKTISHVPDAKSDPSYIAGIEPFKTLVDEEGARSVLVVPMLKEDSLVGTLSMYRPEVAPFNDKQIELVQNFAAQAVIAIENTRLLSELRQRTDDLSESLEQQTATSELLKVISRSKFDLQAILQSVVETAVRLCRADQATLSRLDGDVYRFAAGYSLVPEYLEIEKATLIVSGPGTLVGRAAMSRAVARIDDAMADPKYEVKADAAIAGIRSMIGVPLMREGEPIGVIALARRRVEPFTDREIELVTTFADQAVIAIENVKLFDDVQKRTSELSEALEQQTATSEILSVISSSPGQLQPVFQTMLENAVRICKAEFGTMFRFDNGTFYAVAMLNAPPPLAEFIRRRGRFVPEPGIPLKRMLETKKVIHTIDDAASPDPSPSARFGGARSHIAVPMLKDNELVGAIIIYRQEVQPFTEKQVELVSNFAAQAVIAIENTRLLSELRESLQQQTATADVLKVISRSAFDLQAVLDTLLTSAAKLCQADHSFIFLREGDSYRCVSGSGDIPEWIDYLKQQMIVPGRGTIAARAVLEGRTVHIPDVLADPEYTFREAQKRGGYRTALGVPLIREGTPIGVMVLTRPNVQPFDEGHIALVTTFADQAVIAVENVRLLTELRQRTDDLSRSLEDLETAQDRLVQTQKLASLGQLTAGIAHEIKNPLNFVNNFSSLSTELLDELRENLQSLPIDGKARTAIDDLTDTLRANLGKIEQHGKRADSIVKNMLLHSREGSGEHRLVDINALVEESLNLAYHGARAEKQGFNITLERSFDLAAGELDLFPQEITRVLLNLIANGFYAATKRKLEAANGYEPALSVATKNLGDRVEIRIRDNGTGIPAEVKEKMFNPFFTTKPPGEGTGLGLSLSHDIIVKQHSGTIEVDTKPGEFTEFRIILPRTAASIAKAGGRA